MTASETTNETTAGPDEMRCRACERMERASEGYPCDGCGTFLCVACELRGVSRCRQCAATAPAPRPARA